MEHRPDMQNAPIRKSILAGLLLLAGWSALATEARTPGEEREQLATVALDTRLPAAERMKAMDQLAWDGWLDVDPDSAIHWATMLLGEAERAGDVKMVITARNTLGVASDLKGDYGAALEHYGAGLDLAEQHAEERSIAVALNNIGNIYQFVGDHAAAMEHYIRSLQVRERIGDHKGMASSLANIGTLHYQHGAYQEALAHFRKAAELREGIGDRHGQGAALDNMALVLHAMGELDAALAQQAECLAICEEMNDAIGAATTAHNMALIHMERGELQQAREGLFRYRQAMEESGSQQGLASAYINLGTYALRSGDMSQALNWAGKGWDIASGIGALVQMREAAKVLHDVHAARGDWKQALQHHKLHVHLRDSILQEENQREVMRMQLQYGFDKKEALLAAEQEKKDALAREQIGRRELQRNVSFGGFGLLAVVASIILFQRNRIRRERDRSEELLLNILPYETAQELKEKGSSDARLIDQVTVLFTDFKGFTTMSERLSPKDLVRDLHECFSAFDAICQRHGIEKIKTIGDAYMAAGGIPVPNDRHALDVVAAALEMRDFIAEGKARKMAAGLPYFEIRIGIHTGPVVAGIVGIKKFQYDIWGDTVNTASRMESSGEVGRVNLSGSTCALVREQAGSLFDLTPRGKVHAKGKGEVEMWFVERATAAPGA